jgi:hypothetical protein
LNNTKVFAGKSLVVNDPPSTFQIGAFDETLHGDTFKGEYFQGGIDEVGYYSSALSAAQIQSHYQAGITPTAVPEPASLTLLGIGALSVLGYGCRRWRQPA